MATVGPGTLAASPAAGTWGVPSRMGGSANVAAVVMVVMAVMSASGRVSVSSSMTTSQRQCGDPVGGDPRRAVDVADRAPWGSRPGR